MANAGLEMKRPLSPHLQVYRLIPTMVMSIIHRITGAALYFGTLLIAWWLAAAASGPHYFEWVNAIFGSWFGRLVLFGYTWALIHHMLGGIRHFIWDFGVGLDKPARDNIAWATIVGSAVLTVLVWVVGLVLR